MNDTELKIKKVKFNCNAKGIFLSVEGDPELVRKALQECLSLIAPKKEEKP